MRRLALLSLFPLFLPGVALGQEAGPDSTAALVSQDHALELYDFAVPSVSFTWPGESGTDHRTLESRLRTVLELELRGRGVPVSETPVGQRDALVSLSFACVGPDEDVACAFDLEVVDMVLPMALLGRNLEIALPLWEAGDGAGFWSGLTAGSLPARPWKSWGILADDAGDLPNALEGWTRELGQEFANAWLATH